MACKIITKLPLKIDQDLKLLTGELQSFGIGNVGHGLIIEGKTPSAFFSSEEWANRYDEEDLISRDPVRLCALSTDYKIISWDCISATKSQKIILNERKRVFEAQTGILISIKSPEHHETFTLGCDSKKCDIFSLFKNDYSKIFDYLFKFRKAHLAYYKLDSANE